MADEGRSSRRVKKQIDYAQFGVCDEDDDFQDTAPPAKKSKLAREKNLKLKKDKESKTSKKQGRRSVDDKVYERELEMVLELSKADMHFTPGETSSRGDAASSKSSKGDTGDSTDEAEMPKLEPVTKNSPRKKSPLKKKLPRVIDSDDDEPDAIEVVEEDIPDTPPGRGRKKRPLVVKAIKKLTDSEEENDNRRLAAMDESTDDDFKALDDAICPPMDTICKIQTDSEDDCLREDGDSSDDENGSSSRQSGRGRGRGRGGRSGPKIKARLSATVQLVDKSKKAMIHRAPPGPRPVIHSSPPARTETGDLKIRTPNWLPPGPAGGSARSPLGGLNIKSPTGGIRLGLSKNSKVKPLHGSVKVP